MEYVLKGFHVDSSLDSLKALSVSVTCWILIMAEVNILGGPKFLENLSVNYFRALLE